MKGRKGREGFVLHPLHWAGMTLLSVLVYLAVGLLLADLPNPMLPGAILALNMTVIVIAGGLGGVKAGLLTGLLGTSLTFLLKLSLGHYDPFELYAILPHTVMGGTAGLMARAHVSRITLATTILIGHTLNLGIFLARGLVPCELLHSPDFWNGLLAEVAVDILLIAFVLGLVEHRPWKRWSSSPQEERRRRGLGVLLATLLTGVLIVMDYTQVLLAPYLFFLPVVLAASMVGPLAPVLYAAVLSYPLLERVSYVGLAEGRPQLSLIISLNFVALTVGELVERWRNERTLAEARLKKLQRAYQLLTETARLKQEIIQNVSHELRTPLTILLGHLELLNEGIFGEMNEEQHRSLEKALVYARKLAEIVEQITVLQRLSDGHIDYQSVDLPAVVHKVVQRYEEMASQRGCTLKIIGGEDEHREVIGDPTLMEHVMAALIDNAIKFSPRGGEIEVRLWQEDGRYYCAVIDHGIGIAKELQSRLFQRFYQVNGTMTRRYGGIGVGLAVVREVISAGGGDVWLESQPGQGTTVGFWLPLAHVEASEVDVYLRPQEEEV